MVDLEVDFAGGLSVTWDPIENSQKKMNFQKILDKNESNCLVTRRIHIKIQQSNIHKNWKINKIK